MKFGIHAGLWMQNWTDDASRTFDTIAQIGFDGVEVSLLGVGKSKAENLRKTADMYGLQITCSTGLGVGQDPSSSNKTERTLAKQVLTQQIEITHALGATSLAGVVASPWGVFDPKNISNRLQYSAETLGELQPVLQQYNVKLGIESVNRFESDLVSTADYALTIANQSGAENVGVLLDSFHMNIEEKYPAQMLQKADKKLFHYHISAHDRGVPAQGRYDFTADAKALHSIGYNGWVTAEMFVLSGMPTSRDLNIWRPIETDADTAAKNALHFMKQVYTS